jgi:translation initiation factor IF-1
MAASERRGATGPLRATESGGVQPPSPGSGEPGRSSTSGGQAFSPIEEEHDEVPESAAIRKDGTVLAVLPRGLYRVAIQGGHEVTAHATAGPRRNFVRLVVGDRVIVELSPRDLGRGRIVKRINGQ